MIVIDKPKLKFLLAGRILTITVAPRVRPYRAKHAYAVGLNHRRTVCHAEILKTTITADGVELQIRQITIDPPHLLAAAPGQIRADYTSQPQQAMNHEPEAISGPDLSRYATIANARDQQRTSDPIWQQRHKIAESLAQMRIALQQRPNVELERSVRRLESELRVLDRKLAA